MTLYVRTMIGTAGVSLALALAYALAFLAFAHRQSSAAPSLKPSGPSREIQAASLERPFVATEIGKVYHVADCFYIRKQSRHMLLSLSKEEAEARGLHACTNCVSTSRIARSIETRPFQE